MAIWSPALAATSLLPAFYLLRTKDTETQQVFGVFCCVLVSTDTLELVGVLSQTLRYTNALFIQNEIFKGFLRIKKYPERYGKDTSLGDKDEMMVKRGPSRLETP